MELYDWQREAIDALVHGDGQVLVVAPTGGGKSMCYQQPAIELDGVALVITPLVALMADQVAALHARNIPATYLASSLDAAENERRTAAALAGEFRLLYVAPERLASQRFVDDVLARLTLSLVAVDEAHCISHWGHDFRPDYLQIGDLIERLRPPRIVACTATATPAVRKEIVERLHMDCGLQILRGFARDNLELSVDDVSGPKAKEQRLIEEVKRALSAPGAGNGTAIIYTSQRRHAEDVAEALRHAGWRAEHYHAGLEGVERNAVQARFQSGRLDVVAATNAFGMGIDRSDIRLVAHHAIPESVEAYYQEVGRAGRDGSAARGLLLVSDPDIAWRFKLIAQDPNLDAEQALRRRELLRAMISYAETSACRHDTILTYFEDDAEKLGGCTHCDNCRAAAASTLQPEPDESSSADVVRSALGAIRVLPFAVGAGTLASYLVGNPTAPIKKHEWQNRTEFGILRDRNEEWTKRLLRRFLAAGLLAIDPEHATLRITRRGAEIAAGRRDNPVRLPPTSARLRIGATKPGAKAEIPDEKSMYGDALALLERLRRWREGVAGKQNIPAYAVFHDATLRAIASSQPANDDQLLACGGVGPAKLQKYGAQVLAIVSSGNASAPRDRREGPDPTAPVVSTSSFHDERIAEARREHPRAFERWTDDEDARLRQLIDSGSPLDTLVQSLGRQPSAIKIRAERLALEVAE